jgi:hypothetical protein
MMGSVTSKFKDFDKKFSKDQIDACRQRWLYSGSSHAERQSYTEWPLPVLRWAQWQVQEVVYLADDHEEWQLFRVSMKGLSTSEKLYMLHNRYITLDLDNNQNWVDHCRIDNYISALVRGGQLDSNYKVVR